jgi:iron complex outermembrane receptor protein
MPAKGAIIFKGNFFSPLLRNLINTIFMKKVIQLTVLVIFLCVEAKAQTKESKKDSTLLQSIEITAVRASASAPVSQKTISRKEIQKNNIGYDLPYILNMTPSVQISSDAGNGIGYTGIRIRGTDPTRINVTMNGIPYNDAESQGTYWVDLPDLASSVHSIQIQRGVGTSSNGAGAFGASININTNEIDTLRYLDFNPSFGSYNSYKASLIYNSGLLKKHWIFNGRVSQLGSDGYVERASSKLQSFYTSAAWINGKESFRINIFSGKEKTYAAWFGINQISLDTNRQFNPAGTEKPGAPYDNEIDNYQQTHYQSFYNHSFSDRLKFNLTGFLTTGKGYYEQYKADQALSDYGLAPYIQGTDTIFNSDLIRQLWLKNYFYGGLFSFQYSKDKTGVIFGMNWNQYDGNHFGRIVRTVVAGAVPENYEWYRHTAFKNEISGYLKWNHKFNKFWQTYADIQLRNISYRINGFRYNPDIIVDKKYLFFNPKAGITYERNGMKGYLSYARSAKEPNRDDFEAGVNETPSPEILNDFESGFEMKRKNYNWSVNAYLMKYKNQLVLTGKVNEVYAYTRTNIPNSYRLGVELEGQWQAHKKILLSGNFSLSKNKVRDFTEYIDDYDNGGQLVKKYSSSDISFSPAVIAAASVSFLLNPSLSLDFTGKYVGKQYLDNTSNEQRKLNDYLTQNARISYNTSKLKNTSITFFLQANNVFSKKYVANGYTFSYLYSGNFTTEKYYYPMATFNVMGGFSMHIGNKHNGGQ